MTGREEQRLGLLAVALVGLLIVVCWSLATTDQRPDQPPRPRLEIGVEP